MSNLQGRKSLRRFLSECWSAAVQMTSLCLGDTRSNTCKIELATYNLLLELSLDLELCLKFC